MYVVNKKYYKKEGVCQRGRVNCPADDQSAKGECTEHDMAEMPYKSFTPVFAKKPDFPIT